MEQSGEADGQDERAGRRRADAPPAARARPRLNRERVVRAALTLLDEVGLEGLTLRRLAGALGVQAPALYWHFSSKAALLDELATTVLRDALAAAPPPPPGADWAGWLRAAARGQRRMLLAHRDGAKVFSGTYLTDPALYAPLEAGLAVFRAAGFPPGDAMRALSTVFAYTVGFAIEEQAVSPRPGERDARYDPDRRAERISAERYPLTRAAGAAAFGDADERFEYGLGLIVVGIEASRPPPGDA